MHPKVGELVNEIAYRAVMLHARNMHPQDVEIFNDGIVQLQIMGYKIPEFWAKGPEYMRKLAEELTKKHGPLPVIFQDMQTVFFYAENE